MLIEKVIECVYQRIHPTFQPTRVIIQCVVQNIEENGKNLNIDTTIIISPIPLQMHLMSECINSYYMLAMFFTIVITTQTILFDVQQSTMFPLCKKNTQHYTTHSP